MNQQNTSQINWPQIWSLAALNAAVAISWIAYHEYQPRLLEQFSFTKYASFLAIAQAVVMFVIPPIAGRIGDYFIKRDNNYFIISTIGISVTAMIFMAVAFSISDFSYSFLHAALPIMIVLWLISMNIFHGPANSMVELFASEKDLPIAMATLVLITDLVYAMEPVVVALVDFLGPALTFVTGGVLIIVSGYFFRKTSGNIPLNRNMEARGEKDDYLKVILAGAVAGLFFALINKVLPQPIYKSLSALIPFIKHEGIYGSVILALAALGAMPLSFRIRKSGAGKGLVMGTLFSALSVAGILLFSHPIFIIVFSLALGVSFSIVAVSAFPFALMNLSGRNATFGAGIFFAFMELSDNLLDIFM